ncbi:hypothetical protein GCM10010442_00800 [Kitasatospora kifunensis]
MTTRRVPLLMVKPLCAVPFSDVGAVPAVGAPDGAPVGAPVGALDGAAAAGRLGSGAAECVGKPAAAAVGKPVAAAVGESAVPAVGEVLGEPVAAAEEDGVADGDGVETGPVAVELAVGVDRGVAVAAGVDLAVAVVDGSQEVSSRVVPVVIAMVRLTAAARRRARADMTDSPRGMVRCVPWVSPEPGFPPWASAPAR